VARDPEESGLGTSAYSRSKGTWRNGEAASCDGSHGDGVEYNTWHRHLGTRGSELQGLGIASGDIPKY
jgi:hypothetical protein